MSEETARLGAGYAATVARLFAFTFLWFFFWMPISAVPLTFAMFAVQTGIGGGDGRLPCDAGPLHEHPVRRLRRQGRA